MLLSLVLTAAVNYDECHYAECHYAECHFSECRYAVCRGATKMTILLQAF